MGSLVSTAIDAALKIAEQWAISAATHKAVAAADVTTAAGEAFANVVAYLSPVMGAAAVGPAAATQSAVLGVGLGGTACYEIVVREPTLTIIVFAILGFAAWQVTKNLKGINAALALTFTRMCIIMVNMGFWIGSLRGDSPSQLWRTASDAVDSQELYMHPQIPDVAFVIAWALALLVAGAWAGKNCRRFLVNTAAVFGAIHLYTQWFERLGADPLAVMAAGIATIAIGLGLWHYNRKVLTET